MEIKLQKKKVKEKYGKKIMKIKTKFVYFVIESIFIIDINYSNFEFQNILI